MCPKEYLPATRGTEKLRVRYSHSGVLHFSQFIRLRVHLTHTPYFPSNTHNDWHLSECTRYRLFSSEICGLYRFLNASECLSLSIRHSRNIFTHRLTWTEQFLQFFRFCLTLFYCLWLPTYRLSAKFTAALNQHSYMCILINLCYFFLIQQPFLRKRRDLRVSGGECCEQRLLPPSCAARCLQRFARHAGKPTGGMRKTDARLGQSQASSEFY